MLEYTLLENVAAASFSGRRFMRELHDALVRNELVAAPDRAAFVERCWAELREDVEEYSPRKFRIDDIELALRTVWPHTMFHGPAGNHVPLLDSLFARFFEHDDAGIRYRAAEVEGYVRCAGRIDPALVVAWHIAGKFRTGGAAARAETEALVGSLQPFFSPRPQGDDAYAENHVHLLGMHYDGLVLMSTLAVGPAPTGLDDTMLAALKEFQTLQEFAQGLVHAARPGSGEPDAALETLCIRVLSRYHVMTPRVSYDMLRFADLAGPALADDLDWLRHRMSSALKAASLEHAWIWFLVWCWYQYRDGACAPRRRIAICYLLGSLMDIRRRLLMDGYGLTRFVAYYKEALRGVIGTDAKEASGAARLFQGAGDVAEIKVGAGKVKQGPAGRWLRHALAASGCSPLAHNASLPPAEHAKGRHACERWHYCIHFFRGPGKEGKVGEIWKEANEVAKSIASANAWSGAEFALPSTAWQGKLWPSRWIRTLDVAGNENEGAIEFFAPALRWLREGGFQAALPEVDKPAMAPLALSIHAGEDYAHPLSGMRHIDETVRFCGMRRGDRLGHALAIGIRPRDWFDNHGNAVVPLEEYVDNLVWAWRRSRGLARRHAWAAQAIAGIERALRLLLPHVPWLSFVDGRVPLERVLDVLYRAWRLRRNCHGHVVGTLQDMKGRYACAVPDRQHLGTEERRARSVAAVVYERRWRQLKGGVSLAELLEQKQPPRMNVLVRQGGAVAAPHIETHATGPVAIVTVDAAELTLMEALQDRLLTAYARLGLVLEANPTSNVYIAQLSSHRDHPIFRWDPPDAAPLAPGQGANKFGLRKGPIKVCVNTDDPGIMPTTLRTEFALLRDAAVRNGYDEAAADAWVERLRQAGVDEFNAKHVPLWA